MNIQTVENDSLSEFDEGVSHDVKSDFIHVKSPYHSPKTQNIENVVMDN